MKKTNVDDMLLEMIEPKINEIQERFSRGEGLKYEDINTRLLKSQHNHINHLDAKLNEATSDVASLKTEFSSLKAEFKILDTNLELKIQKAINVNMRWSIGLIAFLVTILKLVDVLLAKMPNLF